MTPELPLLPTPTWLAAIDDPRRPAVVSLPLQDLLKDSLYYPACGLNGTPIKFLGGNVLSFVYTDYGVPSRDYLQDIHDGMGLCGYSIIMERAVRRDEIVPNDWQAPMVPSEPAHIQRLCERQRSSEVYGHWSVWKRNVGFAPTHGPEFLSLLFFGGETSAIYQGLYSRLRIAPKALAIIRPSDGVAEWEDIRLNDSFFHRVVTDNPAGMPTLLLCGGFGPESLYDHPCWPEYEGPIVARHPERFTTVWKLPAAQPQVATNPPKIDAKELFSRPVIWDESVSGTTGERALALLRRDRPSVFCPDPGTVDGPFVSLVGYSDYFVFVDPTLGADAFRERLANLRRNLQLHDAGISVHPRSIGLDNELRAELSEFRVAHEPNHEGIECVFTTFERRHGNETQQGLILCIRMHPVDAYRWLYEAKDVAPTYLTLPEPTYVGEHRARYDAGGDFRDAVMGGNRRAPKFVLATKDAFGWPLSAPLQDFPHWPGHSMHLLNRR